MTTTEERDLLQDLTTYEEIGASVGPRTFEILAQRRKTSTIRRRGWLVRRMLVLADVVGLLIAFFAAQAIRGRAGGIVTSANEYVVFAATLPGWIIAAKLLGLYAHDEERTHHSTVDEISGVFHLVTLGAWISYAGSWITGVASPDLTKVVLFWVFGICSVALCRTAARALSRRSITYVQNAVVVGAGDVGQLIGRKLLHHPEYGINLVGFVDDRPKERRDDLQHLALLGGPARLPAIVRLFDIERVIIAFSNESHDASLELIRSLKDLDVQIDIVPRLYELLGPSVGIHTVEGLPLIGLLPLRLTRSARVAKRMLDVVGSLAGLIVLAPFFLVTAILIKLDSSGPVFFRQERMGASETTFRLLKFRTMVEDADATKPEFAHLNAHIRNGDSRLFKIEDDPRVTRAGRVLRRYMVDELPQLVNVLRGHMSLVGPRPLILEEDRQVGTWGRRRLDLKPGMTGLWQVLGRNAIGFDEMVKLDYIYVTTWSLWHDCRLLLRTIPLVIRGDGANY